MKVLITLLLMMVCCVGYGQKITAPGVKSKTKQYLSKMLEVKPGQRPLILINDSVYVGEIDSINMDNVETFDVIRDTVATKEIYGNDASHGVVLITVKNDGNTGSQLSETKIRPDEHQPTYMVDGESVANIKAISPNDIFHIDVIRYEKSRSGDTAKEGNPNGTIILTTKKYAHKQIVNKLIKFSVNYSRYIQINPDGEIIFKIDNKSANEQTVYNLPADQIKRVTFKQSGSLPLMNILTKK